MHPAAPPPKEPLVRAPWPLILVLVAVTTTSYVDRIAISVLAPTLRDEFGMSNSQYYSESRIIPSHARVTTQ